MLLIVRVSAVMSSLPRSGMRRERSVVVISRAVLSRVRSGARRRPDWKAAMVVISPSESSAMSV